MNPPEIEPSGWRQLLLEVAHHWPPDRWRDVGVIVGCSGGADSVALLCCLAELRKTGLTGEPTGDQALLAETMVANPRGSLYAAHFNHNLRGEESDQDEAFVESLAAQLGVGFLTERGHGQRRDESSLRNDRLQFLVDAAKRVGARYIALAHSAEDNVETILHHLLRGTGPAGLAGIGSPRPIDQDLVLIRPLLATGRNAIRQSLRSTGQTWREDSSNTQTDYRRNWIRHRLMPFIETEYPNATNAIHRTIDAQRQWRCVIDRLAKEWLEARCLATEPLTLQRDPQADPAIVIAAAQALWGERGWGRGDMGQEQWTRLSVTLQSEARERYTLPGDIDVDASDRDVVLLPLSRVRQGEKAVSAS